MSDKPVKHYGNSVPPRRLLDQGVSWLASIPLGSQVNLSECPIVTQQDAKYARADEAWDAFVNHVLPRFTYKHEDGSYTKCSAKIRLPAFTKEDKYPL